METRVNIINNETHLQGSLRDLTVYSSNLAELKSSKDAGSKIKYRVSENIVQTLDYRLSFQILQPASIDVFMAMNENSQKIDVRITDIMISIAPAAIRTMIGVTSSLGTLQVLDQDKFIEEKMR